MACYEWRVDPDCGGLRLDDGIQRNLPFLPWPALQEAFKRRDVKLNGRRVKPDTRVSSGDLVQVYCMEKTAPVLDIVYEDTDVLLVNKRAGLSVEPDGAGLSLTELVSAYTPDAVPCHRLDNQTSGLVIFAKNSAAEAALELAFRSRALEKHYQCLVRGIPKPPEAECSAWLLKDAAAARVTVLDRPLPGALRIVTGYETLKAGPVSRLRVHLITGRTHQIRAHLAALGHPLLGDDVYGDRAFNRQQHARRLMLCACELRMETGGALPQLDGRTFRIPCPF